jgi:hypothetical protein
MMHQAREETAEFCISATVKHRSTPPPQPVEVWGAIAHLADFEAETQGTTSSLGILAVTDAVTWPNILKHAL